MICLPTAHRQYCHKHGAIAMMINYESNRFEFDETNYRTQIEPEPEENLRVLVQAKFDGQKKLILRGLVA